MSKMLPVLILAMVMVAVAGCGRSEVPQEPPPTPRPPTSTGEHAPGDIEEVLGSGVEAGSFQFEAYAYECGEIEVVVRPGDGVLELMLPGSSRVLPQVEAASGARYADGDTGFWGRGINSAVLTIDGEDIQCTLDREKTPWVDAQVRGAKFRGFGQEPGWHLEIHAERIVFVYRYGDRRAVLPNSGVISDPEQPVRAWEATTEEHEFSVTVEDRGCTDVMSGQAFPAKVSVKLDGRDYTGCGKDLE
jgi:putative lipoprotein